MSQLFTYAIFANFAMAVLVAVMTKIVYSSKTKLRRAVVAISIASALWSLLMGMMVTAPNEVIAYWVYRFGMLSVFFYLGCVVLVYLYVCNVYERYKKIYWTLVGGSTIAWGIMAIRGEISVTSTEYGYICGLTEGISFYILNVFFISFGVLLMLAMFRVIHEKQYPKRVLVFTRRYFVSALIMTVGNGLDAFIALKVGPMPPFAGIIQFWAIVVLYFTLVNFKRSELSISNMTEYMFTALSMPVLIYDKDYNLVLLNNMAENFFDIDMERIHFNHYPVDSLFDIDYDRFIFDMPMDHHDFRGVCKHNDVNCLLSTNRIKDHYGEVTGYIIIVSDQTEYVRVLEDLKEAKKGADAANQAKSDFLANMSHEIRTPMNAVSGFSELMLKMDDLPEEARNYASDIRDSAKNLLAIINDILDLSKIEAGRMELVESTYYPKRVLQDIYSVNRQPVVQKGLELVMDIDPNIPDKVYGDRVKLRSMLMNILNNAVKYTAKGKITFTAKILERTDSDMKIRFDVKDTGMGIKKEEIEGLFNSFEQVNKSLHEGIEGTGLGLSIVKGYAELMGGEVLVESEFGVGSTFSIIVTQKVLDWTPIGEFITDSGDKEKSSIGSLRVRDTNVLVVDDNMVNLRVAQATLKTYGMTVDIASSGGKAIEMCADKRYDIVFMDQMMPVMDGIEAMHHIRDIDDYYKNECIVIVLTANAITGARDALLAEGFDEYLGKPMNYNRLEQLIHQFISAERITD